MPGSRLATARKRNGYTQQQLADLTHIPRHRLARLEKADNATRVSAQEIQKICSALNMSADWWFRGDTASADATKRRALSIIDNLTAAKRRLLLTLFDLMV